MNLKYISNTAFKKVMNIIQINNFYATICIAWWKKINVINYRKEIKKSVVFLEIYTWNIFF